MLTANNQKQVEITVIVLAYNEEKLIGQVLSTMPSFVDRVIVVDDKSKDKTVEIVEDFQKRDSRISLIKHEKNQGVGKAMSTGYLEAERAKAEVSVLIAGDAQMHPDDMINIVMPVVNKEADYSKGNRFFFEKSWKIIPHHRYLGNAFLSLLTKIASGYWHIADSQTGYTAISLKALKAIDMKSIYKSYGVPNDILIRLNVHNFKVRDVPIQPIYGQGEKSGIKLRKMIPAVSWLLFRGFLKRLWKKYVIRDFHPLVFFYFLGIFLLLVSIPLFIRLVYIWIFAGFVPQTTALALMFFIITSLQFLLFAMWFDMDYNKDLK